MKKIGFLSIWFVFSFFFISTANAQQAVAPAAPELNLITDGKFAGGLTSWQPKKSDVATYEVREITDENGTPSKVFHAELNVKPETKTWDAALHQQLPFVFNAGEKVVLTGKARSPQSLPFYAYLEETDVPNVKQTTVKMPLTPQWQYFEARGVLTRYFAPNEMRVGFQLASGNGSIEITDVKLSRSAPDPTETTVNPADSLLALNGDFLEPLADSWVTTARIPVRTSVIDLNNDGPAGLKKALKVELDSPDTANLWDGRIAPPKTPTPIKKGDMVLVQFWGRSDRKNRVSAVYQQASTPYDKVLREISYLSPKWKKFTYYGRAVSDFAAGESNFEIQIGGVKGSVEFAGIHVENLGAVSGAVVWAKYGPNTIDYFGAETPNDDWKAAAYERIEKYRKVDIEINVVDANGKPIPNAKVNVVQTRQAFRFGTAVNSWLFNKEADGEQYRATLKRLFNTAVIENDMKWRLTDESKDAEQRGIDSVKWLRDNGLEVRGHTMLWGSWRYSPPRLEKLSREELRDEIKKHIFEVGQKFQGQVYVWDVVNEAATNTEIFEKAGWDLFPQVFKWAREADKNALLAYNDYDISNESTDGSKHRTQAETRIQQLLDAGAPVDILGDQAHMFTPFTTMPRMLEIWDDWSKKYKKPLEITEFDAGIGDDAMQEKYVRDYLIAAFSQPNIESFVMWGFWSKAHWRGTSASLYRDDWTPRPAALAVEDLILKQWKTNLSLSTDAKGRLKTRGFLGDYEIQVSANGKETKATVKLTKNGLSQTVVLN